MSDDIVTRVICEYLNLRAYTVTSLDTVRHITGLHGTTPNATVALGRTINAAALLGATLKPDSLQNVSLRLSGTGPIREIIAQADARGNIRGYVANPAVDLVEDIGKISFSRTIGAGFLTVTKDLGLREPYKSIMPLKQGEVALDVAYYLAESEQIPSALILGLRIARDASIQSSGGILIQTFPDTDTSVIDSVELRIRSMPRSLSDELAGGRDPLEVLRDLLEGAPLHAAETYPLRASCRCSREMLSSLLLNIPLEELEAMAREDRGAELTCSFCTKRYHFSEAELNSIIHKIRSR